MKENASNYLTIREVAERWRVSYDTIRRELDAGKLAYIKVGGLYRINRDAVEAREHAELQKGVRNVKRSLSIAGVSSKDHYPEC